ncbi:hypothetical protein ACLB1O_24260 [Escherichia coli]
MLSNEKFRGVPCLCSENQLKITANNPEQEEAEERSSTLPIAVRRWKSASTSVMCWMF